MGDVDKETLRTLLRGLPRVKVTPDTITQAMIDRWGEARDKMLSDFAEIAELLPGECPAPDVHAGQDLCPWHPEQSWPCNLTKAYWLATGVDRAKRTRQMLDELAKPSWYYEEG